MSEQSALPMLTFKDVAQPIFDKVWERAKNKTRAADTSGKSCKYRVALELGTAGANACFIGVCMTDEEYKPTFEGKPVTKLWIEGLWYPQGLHQMPDMVQRNQLRWMCENLQYTHDVASPVYWQQKLRELAHSHKLTIPTEKETT